MTNYGCCCGRRCRCAGIAVAVSILIGIVAAFLSFYGVITVTPILAAGLLAASALFLAVVLVTAAILRSTGPRECVCSEISAVLVGILGMALTAILILITGIADVFVLGAIVTGFLLAFLTLTALSLACLVRYVSGCSSGDGTD